jgi:hypothetical protein
VVRPRLNTEAEKGWKGSELSLLNKAKQSSKPGFGSKLLKDPIVEPTALWKHVLVNVF